MRWQIYNKSGSRKQVRVNNVVTFVTVSQLEYNGSWMEDTFISANVKCPVPVTFNIGDYIIYRNERYTINEDVPVVKRARKNTYGEGFEYKDLKFYSESVQLKHCSFLDYVLNDNMLHYSSLPEFSFYAQSVKDLADRIQANLDRLHKDTLRWKVRVLLTDDTYYDAFDTSSTSKPPIEKFPGYKGVNISISNITCWEALNMVEEQFNLKYTIRGREIRINAKGANTGEFKYGKGNGLKEIERTLDPDQEIITRLHAYGSTKNLPLHYYANLGTYCFTTSRGVTKFNTDATPYAQWMMLEVELAMNSYYFRRYNVGQTKAFVYNDPNPPTQVGSVDYIGKVRFKNTNGEIGSNEYNVGFGRHTTATDGRLRIFLANYAAEKNVIWKAQSQAEYNSFYEEAISSSEVIFTDGVILLNFPFANRKGGYNLPNNLAITRLMLPGFPDETFDPYIEDADAVAKYGIRETVVYFDKEDEENGITEIYPSIKEMTAQDANVYPFDETRLDLIVEAEDIKDNGVYENGNTVEPFWIKIRDFGVDMMQAKSDNPSLKIMMESGMCGSRDFNVAAVEKEIENGHTIWKLICERHFDSGLNLYFPYKGYNIASNDEFVLLEIELPEVYVNAAANKLKRYAENYLADKLKLEYTYTPVMDNIFMARQHEKAIEDGTTSLHDTIKEGDEMTISDADLDMTVTSTIDKLTIREGYSAIPEYTVVLKDGKKKSFWDKIHDGIINDATDTVIDSGVIVDRKEFDSNKQKFDNTISSAEQAIAETRRQLVQAGVDLEGGRIKATPSTFQVVNDEGHSTMSIDLQGNLVGSGGSMRNMGSPDDQWRISDDGALHMKGLIVKEKTFIDAENIRQYMAVDQYGEYSFVWETIGGYIEFGSFQDGEQIMIRFPLADEDMAKMLGQTVAVFRNNTNANVIFTGPLYSEYNPMKISQDLDNEINGRPQSLVFTGCSIITFTAKSAYGKMYWLYNKIQGSEPEPT